jgi:hypothetical protein
MLPAATIRTLTTPSSPPPSSPLTQWDSAEDKAKFANEDEISRHRIAFQVKAGVRGKALQKQKRRINNIASTGRPAAAKGWVRSAAPLGGSDPGATRRLCPGRIARALLGFVFEEISRQDEIRRIQMELRRVDPRTLQKNPGNPRKIQPGEMSDAALKASIKVIGIIQPPTVSEKDGALTAPDACDSLSNSD